MYIYIYYIILFIYIYPPFAGPASAFHAGYDAATDVAKYMTSLSRVFKHASIEGFLK